MSNIHFQTIWRTGTIFFGADFDAILGILEEEEELDEQFKEAAADVSIRFFLSHPEFSEKHSGLTFVFFLKRLHTICLPLVADCTISLSCCEIFEKRGC